MRRFNVSSPRLRLLLLGFCSLLVVVAILNLSPQLAPSQPAHASLIDIWHSIFKNPPPPPPRRGISRGDDFCPVAPVTRSSSAELPKVWSDRPTLAWLGTSTAVREMAIFPKDSETPIWVWSNPAIQQSSRSKSSQSPNPHHVKVETLLSPGQIYEWRVIRPLTPEKDIIRFQTMTSEEIKSIAQGLPTANGVGDSSALKRADYYAGQHLWSDFWQEIFSVRNPSVKLNQLITKTFEAQCPRTGDSAQP
ncbi:hypothetical protein FNW02_06080 [Komarekiella sp. 'clone 1']|uniref:DUF928 domain-containing protein n=1 Tax=Komarekiella delphini-convector SJRDD-AB1 TaxID=2593771 RepID=A0AA40SUB6_9NOST|nr:hypothetical protein [Komarekiella delphini-convector]MBD6615423.1 hypothetical protein [Komarekiella delphini-convector SJRDD-AB1]